MKKARAAFSNRQALIEKSVQKFSFLFTSLQILELCCRKRVTIANRKVLFRPDVCSES